MKAQCDRCREIVPLVFAVAPPNINVSCPACGADYLVAGGEPTAAAPAPRPEPTPRPEPLASPEPLPPDAMTCPKCGEPQKKADACRRCGLAADKFAAWDESGSDGSDDATVSVADVRTAATLFAACEEAWGDPARHDAFVAHCQRVGAWAYAAACYRKQTARADRQAVASTRLADIRGLAEKSLLAMARPLRPEDGKTARNPMRTVALMMVVVVLLVVGIFFITSHFGAVARPTR